MSADWFKSVNVAGFALVMMVVLATMLPLETSESLLARWL